MAHPATSNASDAMTGHGMAGAWRTLACRAHLPLRCVRTCRAGALPVRSPHTPVGWPSCQSERTRSRARASSKPGLDPAGLQQRRGRLTKPDASCPPPRAPSAGQDTQLPAPRGLGPMPKARPMSPHHGAGSGGDRSEKQTPEGKARVRRSWAARAPSGSAADKGTTLGEDSSMAETPAAAVDATKPPSACRMGEQAEARNGEVASSAQSQGEEGHNMKAGGTPRSERVSAQRALGRSRWACLPRGALSLVPRRSVARNSADACPFRAASAHKIPGVRTDRDMNLQRSRAPTKMLARRDSP